MRGGGVVGDIGQKGEKAVHCGSACTERACIHLQYRPLNVQAFITRKEMFHKVHEPGLLAQGSW